MKIKFIPQDFIVEEKINLENLLSNKESNFLLLRITKKNITTFQALQQIKKLIQNQKPLKNLKFKINFLGLKDKYSYSIQYFCLNIFNESLKTIKKEKFLNILKNHNLNNEKLKIEFLGFLKNPLSQKDLQGNEFNINLRSIDKKELKLYLQNINNFKTLSCFLNYYDYQRVKIDFPEEIKNLFNQPLTLENLSNILQEILQNIDKLQILPNKENIYNYHFIKNREYYILNSLKFNILTSLKVLEYLNSKNTKEKIGIKVYFKGNIMLIPSLEKKEYLQEIMKVFNLLENLKILNRNVVATFSNFAFDYSYDEFDPLRFKINIKFYLDKGSYATSLIKHIIPFPHFSSLKYKPLYISN